MHMWMRAFSLENRKNHLSISKSKSSLAIIFIQNFHTEKVDTFARITATSRFLKQPKSNTSLCKINIQKTQGKDSVVIEENKKGCLIVDA